MIIRRKIQPSTTWIIRGSILCLLTTITLFAIDISPSKYQGGSTNNVPNKTTDAPSLLQSPLKWIFGSGRSSAMERIKAPPNFKVELSTEPKVFLATANAPLKAHMVVINQGDDKYILEFDTAQHYDFIITDQGNKEVYRYSNDKAFTQEFSSILLNRNEKLVYEDDLFTGNQAGNIPPGTYKLIGKITARVPISAEISFQVSR